LHHEYLINAYDILIQNTDKFNRQTHNTALWVSVVGLILLMLDWTNFSRFQLPLQFLKAICLALVFLTYLVRNIVFISRKRIKRTQRKQYRINILVFSSLMLIILLPMFIMIESNLIKYYTHAAILLIFFIEVSKKSVGFSWMLLNPSILFVLSFIFIVLLGSILLMLPRATLKPIAYIDALFTSASAVCVTGLTTIDTEFTFTKFGLTVIAFLIQIGGLGVMVFSSFFGLFFRKSTSFRNQLVLRDMVVADNMNAVFKALKKAVLLTITIELVGAILMYISLDSSVFPNWKEKLYFSVFHSISAFCNAGFSTFTGNLYDVRIRYNYNIHLIIAFLIIMGGLGFHIIANVYDTLKHYAKNKYNQLMNIDKYHHQPVINLNTKIVIMTTVILLVVGTVFYFILEWDNMLRGRDWWGKTVLAFFCSVTSRTAGFNNVDMSAMLPSTALITIVLMWIGASPGSTGGGIKTSTFFVAVMNIVSMVRGKDRLEFQNREIAQVCINRAFAAIFISLFIISVGVFLITISDKNKTLISIVFEVVSAFATVGLSLGITFNLTPFAKMVIIVIMFLGRVGLITILIGIVPKINSLKYKYPQEEVVTN